MNLFRTTTILSVILLVCWLVPQQGKKLAPAIFGGPAVQWTSAVIVAILIPIVVLLSLKLLLSGRMRKAGHALLVCACLPLFANLAIFAMGGLFLDRAGLRIKHSPNRELEMIATLTDRAVEADSATKRGGAASLLYAMFGVRPVWQNEQGKLERYDPTVEDQGRWERAVDTSQIEAKTIQIIDGQLDQLPWLFGLYLGSFGLIVFVGLTWYAYKPNRGPDAMDQPAAGPPPH